MGTLSNTNDGADTVHDSTVHSRPPTPTNPSHIHARVIAWRASPMGYAYYTATGNSALSPNQSCRRAVCCGQVNCCGPLIFTDSGDTQVPAPRPRAPKSCVGPSQHCLHQRRSLPRTASVQQTANSWKGSRLSRGPTTASFYTTPGGKPAVYCRPRVAQTEQQLASYYQDHRPGPSAAASRFADLDAVHRNKPWAHRPLPPREERKPPPRET